MRLERAERAVQEFDKTSLTRKEVKTEAARESLSGKGLIEAVKQIQALPEDQRRDFLGDSQEVNAAYKIFTEEFDSIVERQSVIQDAMAKTGTDQSPVALRNAAAAADPRLAALKETVKSENALEIAREENRAVQEGERQTQTNRNLQGAENAGASPFRIALAENAAETLQGFGVQNAQDVIPGISGNAIANLERDLSLAQNAGDGQAAKTLLAANQLRQRRNTDKNAILSRDETAQYLSSENNFVTPGDVSEDQQRELTRSIIEEANNARGIERSLSTSLLRPLAGAGSVLAQSGLDSAAGEGTAASSRIAERMLEALEKNNAMMERQNVVLEQNAEASSKTADNTVPRVQQPNAGEIARQARQK